MNVFAPMMFNVNEVENDLFLLLPRFLFESCNFVSSVVFSFTPKLAVKTMLNCECIIYVTEYRSRPISSSSNDRGKLFLDYYFVTLVTPFYSTHQPLVVMNRKQYLQTAWKYISRITFVTSTG